MSVARQLAQVQRRIDAACRQAGRDPATVTLICVTKTVSEQAIREAYAAGARDFGESYAQQLRDKEASLADLPDLRWHFIGGLQRNKVKYVAGRSVLIHSVDSPELVREIERRAERAGREQAVLVQLNLAGEATKSGIAAAPLAELLASFAACRFCRCQGLMTMPPFFDDPQAARPYFSRLRLLQQEAATVARPNVDLQHLSMGMSGDLEAAIAEGATLVRVGTAIFGGRG